jgi:hypothetical protein
MMSTAFWDIEACSPLKIKGTLLRNVSPPSWGPKNNNKTWLILRPWNWRRYVSSKHRLTLNGLHGVIAQKTRGNVTAEGEWDWSCGLIQWHVLVLGALILRIMLSIITYLVIRVRESKGTWTYVVRNERKQYPLTSHTSSGGEMLHICLWRAGSVPCGIYIKESWAGAGLLRLLEFPQQVLHARIPLPPPAVRSVWPANTLSLLVITWGFSSVLVMGSTQSEGTQRLCFLPFKLSRV